MKSRKKECVESELGALSALAQNAKKV